VEVERKEGEETDTMDIYKEKERRQMLEEDEITATEGVYIAGREIKIEKEEGLHARGEGHRISLPFRRGL
jgi:hypothetical protein